MRISDWSSDVCSSDLTMGRDVHAGDPHLAAVDPPAVDAVAGLAHRTGFHVGRVAAMVGFGQAEGGAAAPLEPAEDEFLLLLSSERRRVGKECGIQCRFGWAPSH